MGPNKILVTGGTGFLGLALVKQLVADGHAVVSVARGENDELSKLGVDQVRLDIGAIGAAQNAALLKDALKGVDLVFHIAAKVAMWGRRADFLRVNVAATEALLTAAQQSGVRRFVYTSSPSVIASGVDLKGVNESLPYPAHYEAFYPETKATAERLVLGSHREGFSTVALRPHLIFGPGDTNLVPTIISKAKAGRLSIIGHGENRADFSFIDDCVQAHLCAARALSADSKVGGVPYFVSQGEPTKLWDFINTILEGIGEKPITRRLPTGVAHGLASVLELGARIIGREPPLTRFLVSELATDHYFDISAARTKLGFQPRVTMAAGLQKTIEWLKVAP
jgi:nucleoside-diphosphate-sugar epimerase